MKYRKRPVVIDAVQWTGENDLELLDFVGFGCTIAGSYCIIRTLEGDMRAAPKDWVIRGVKGEFYPCKPDIFAATYEPLEEAE